MGNSPSAYQKKLLDPRWQKKRLQILERDEFTCRSCGNGEETLHVDHSYYQPGHDPWNYPEWSLNTLCEKCHKDAGFYRKFVGVLMGVNFDAWEQLFGYIAAHDVLAGRPHRVPAHVMTEEFFTGLFDVLCVKQGRDECDALFKNLPPPEDGHYNLSTEFFREVFR